MSPCTISGLLSSFRFEREPNSAYERVTLSPTTFLFSATRLRKCTRGIPAGGTNKNTTRRYEAVSIARTPKPRCCGSNTQNKQPEADCDYPTADCSTDQMITWDALAIPLACNEYVKCSGFYSTLAARRGLGDSVRTQWAVR